MDNRRRLASGGFTVIELLMVTLVLSVLAAVGVGLVSTDSDYARFEETRRRMTAIKQAVLGANDINNDGGRRTSFGYVGDWGSLPASLSNLTSSQLPAWSFTTLYGIGSGWRGPYLDANVNTLSTLSDGWGRTFTWAPGAATPALTSLGADNAAGGSGANADLVMEFPTSAWSGTVRGRVLSGATAQAGVTVVIHYPVNGVLTASAPAVTDANGAYSFTSVPYGIRAVRATAPTAAGPTQVVVDRPIVVAPAESLNYGTVSSPDVNSMCCRLSLSSTTAVTDSDITGATLYLVPHKGNRMTLYDGAAWVEATLSSSLSIPAPAATGTNFDVFAYSSSGNITVETVNWTNDTTRATALTTQDGILVKSGDATRRYLGTARTLSGGGLSDSEAYRYVWNYYNRERRELKATDATASWTTTDAAWHMANGSSNNRVRLVVGWDDALVHLTASVRGSNSAATPTVHYVGIDEDGTSTSNADIDGRASSSTLRLLESFLNIYPSVGFHYYQWMERAGSSGTTTFESAGLGLSGYVEG